MLISCYLASTVNVNNTIKLSDLLKHVTGVHSAVDCTISLIDAKLCRAYPPPESEPLDSTDTVSARGVLGTLCRSPLR